VRNQQQGSDATVGQESTVFTGEYKPLQFPSNRLAKRLQSPNPVNTKQTLSGDLRSHTPPPLCFDFSVHSSATHLTHHGETANLIMPQKGTMSGPRFSQTDTAPPRLGHHSSRGQGAHTNHEGLGRVEVGSSDHGHVRRGRLGRRATDTF